MTTWLFATPGWLAALIVVAVVVWLRRRQRMTVLVVPHALSWRRGSIVSRALWPVAAGYAGVVLLVMALARPQWTSEEAPEKRPGYDLILAIDLSTSMYAEDFQRDGRTLNRLQTIKPIIEAFVSRRPDDRIGIVAFAGRAYTFAPLTFDHEWLRRQTSRLAIGAVEDGTAIGDALGVSLGRLEQGARHKELERLGSFVILLTDGASNRGALDPRAAAGLAAERGVAVYAIGAGGDGLVPMPVFDHTGKRTGTEMRRAEIDDLLLRDIAENTRGHYFRATDTQAIEQAFAAIDAATRSTLVVPPKRVTHEMFPLLIAASVVCFVVAIAGTAPIESRKAVAA